MIVDRQAKALAAYKVVIIRHPKDLTAVSVVRNLGNVSELQDHKH